LDAGLSDHDRAVGRLVRRTLEEATYFVGMYVRWHEDAGWAHLRPEIKKLIPRPLSPIASLIRGKVRKTLQAQGTGRHSRDEIMAMGAADWDAVAAVLADRPFVLGDEP